MAILNFESAHKKLPTGGEGTDFSDGDNGGGRCSRKTVGCSSLLLPFIEHSDIYPLDLTKSYRDTTVNSRHGKRSATRGSARGTSPRMSARATRTWPTETVTGARRSSPAWRPAISPDVRQPGLLRHGLHRHQRRQKSASDGFGRRPRRAHYRTEGALTVTDGAQRPLKDTTADFVDGTSVTSVPISAISDGTSNTIAVIEDAGRICPESAQGTYGGT